MMDQRIKSAVHCKLITSFLIVLANYIVLSHPCSRELKVGVGGFYALSITENIRLVIMVLCG